MKANPTRRKGANDRLRFFSARLHLEAFGWRMAIWLGKSPSGVYEKTFFETGGVCLRHLDDQTTGNPVQIGDGCATVTGYKLPRPLIRTGLGRRERGSRPEVRISVWSCSSWSRPRGARFSVYEKDETSPAARLSRGSVVDLHTPLRRSLKVLSFSDSILVSHVSRPCRWDTIHKRYETGSMVSIVCWRSRRRASLRSQPC
jgi:hypothetical protein